ncbi:hypothetical protein K461DRAFT_296889 [Myriangium duriaei CBS 260.36]|uniref:Uncharacterized protein n=1 Tax=Myriangium duriaei CBS 260.36 TaxID=1168546 RepID=A0A9P4IZ43_9PEZI|nr:hypothetical protein K461DRAFT_296889 [Myriangium duriaei CBS 260.36]
MLAFAILLVIGTWPILAGFEILRVKNGGKLREWDSDYQLVVFGLVFACWIHDHAAADTKTAMLLNDSMGNIKLLAVLVATSMAAYLIAKTAAAAQMSLDQYLRKIIEDQGMDPTVEQERQVGGADDATGKGAEKRRSDSKSHDRIEKGVEKT